MSFKLSSSATSLTTLVIVLIGSATVAQGTITYEGTWGNYGSGNSQFEAPWGIATGPTGNVYVTDYSPLSRVQYFDRNGGYLGQFGTPGTGNGQFLGGSFAVGVSSTGTVYATDPGNHRIESFTSTGSYVSQWSGSPSFTSALGTAVSPNGNIYVADGNARNVREFTATGGPITTINEPISNSFTSPYHLATSPSGNLYVSDISSGLVQKFDSSGNFQSYWNVASPTGIGVSGTGNVYVASNTGNTVTEFDSAGNVLTTFGSTGSGPGQLSNPNGVAVAPTGDIYVVDGSNARVEHWFDSAAWVSGSNTFLSATIGSGQLLGASQTISAGKSLTATSTVINSDGALAITGGSVTTTALAFSGIGGTALLSSGTVNVSSLMTLSAGATLTMTGGSLTAGTLSLNGPGNTLQFTGGTISVSTFSLTSGAGYQLPIGQTIYTTNTSIGTGSTLTVNGTLYNGAGVAVTGLLTGGGQVTGTLTNNSGGEVRVAAAQHLWFSSTSPHSNAGLIDAVGGPAGVADVEFSGALTNAANTGLISAQGGTNLRFDGGLANNGSLAASFGQANIFGKITNNATGHITVGTGANATFYDDLVQNGTLTIAPGSTAEVLGAFSGSGGFTGGGTLRQVGDLRPGNSPALVNFGGNLVIGASSTYHMELGGTSIGSQYDSVTVTGAATLGGTLEVDLLNGFQPSLGQQFVALNAGSVSGDFGRYANLSVGNHLTMHHAFAGTDLILTARPSVDGDVTVDGIVNGQDISLVASNWLRSGIAGDANGDGIVNGQDIAMIASEWLRQDIAGGAGSGAAVPEPSTMALAIFGLSGLIVWECPGKRLLHRRKKSASISTC